MTRLLLIAAAILAGCSTSSTARKPAQASDAEARTQAELDADVEEIYELFKGVITSRHGASGPGVDRPVFVKTHGCATGTFTIAKDLPEVYRQGLFATPDTKQVWVRFSSDTIKTTPDKKGSTVGLAIKVLNVPGKKVLQGEEDSTSQDFLLQNHHVFFVDTAQQFLHIFDGKHPDFDKEHPDFKRILNVDMKKKVSNVLTTAYWSTLPYALGEKDHVKYKVVPCTQGLGKDPMTDDPDFLRERLERDFKLKPICLELQMQLRKGDMELDLASVEWSEAEKPNHKFKNRRSVSWSTPQTVATINLDPQDIAQNTKTCEKLSFTAWHALEAHKPVGSIGYARGVVYKRLADLRRSRNSFPLTEPQSTKVEDR